MSPRALNKLQIGQQENITWQTGGLYAPANYYSGTILASGPLAYYRLDDASGTVATDSSGNGLNATYVGGVQLGQAGALPFDSDTAVTLDGSTGYVQLPKLTSDFTSGFSRRGVGRPDIRRQLPAFLRPGQRHVLLTTSSCTGWAHPTTWRSRSSSGSNQGNVVVAPNAITLNQWQYFAVTMDAKGNVTLYKNGVAIATGTTYVPRTGIVRAGQLPGQEQLRQRPVCRLAGRGGHLCGAVVGRPDRGALCPAESMARSISICCKTARSCRTSPPSVPDNYSYAWTIPANMPRGRRLSGASHGEQRLRPHRQLRAFVPDRQQRDGLLCGRQRQRLQHGTDASDPMASLSALLTAYPALGSGDTVHVGPGTYTLVGAVVLGAGHSGLTITGPTSGPPAVLFAEQ